MPIMSKSEHAAQNYYVLAVFDRQAGKFMQEFGDYDKKVVQQELIDHCDSYDVPKKHCKVLTCGPTQESIDAAIGRLNDALGN